MLGSIVIKPKKIWKVIKIKRYVLAIPVACLMESLDIRHF